MFLSKNAGHDVAQLILLSASSSVALANSEAAKAKMLAEEGLANTKWCSDLGQKKPIKKRFSFGVKKPMCLKKKSGENQYNSWVKIHYLHKSSRVFEFESMWRSF